MNANVATLSELRTQQMAPREAQMPAVRAGFFDLQAFELTQRVSKAFASSDLVPNQYKGNVANCMIALNLAQRLGADPLMVMQNLVIVHGRPTWSAQFLIATANMCGRFSALRFEFFGERNTDSWGCRAWAVEKATGEKLVGSDITVAIAKKEGWYGKNGSKWQSIPQQMLMYRAGSWWVRAYAPELSMGLMTADEAVDMGTLSEQADGTYAITADTLRDVTGAVETQAAESPAPAEEKPAPVRGRKSAASEPAEDKVEPLGARVRRQLEAATDTDTLDVAADLIGEIASNDEADDLTAFYKARRAELSAA